MEPCSFCALQDDESLCALTFINRCLQSTSKAANWQILWKYLGFSVVPDAVCALACVRLAVYRPGSPWKESLHLPLRVHSLHSYLCFLWHPPAFPLEIMDNNTVSPQTSPSVRALPWRGLSFSYLWASCCPTVSFRLFSPGDRVTKPTKHTDLQLDLLCNFFFCSEKYKRNCR